LELSAEGSYQDALETFGEFVRHVPDYQFNKRVDIVCYELSRDCSTREPGHNEAWFARKVLHKC